MPVEPKEPLVVDRPSETTKIFGWRFECLKRAGYDFDAAWRIAESYTVDLHEAVRLLESGCCVTTALLILL